MKHPPVVRVCAGALKGRALRYPRGGERAVRPSAARTKESVFEALQDEVRGAVFVDLYAAAGGVGIEALSRGAAFVHFVERDPGALAMLRENLAACGADRSRARVHAEDVVRFVAAGGLSDPSVRVVFADPPYTRSEGDLETLLAVLDERTYPHVRWLVVEHRWPLPRRDWRCWRVERIRRFGDTSLAYLTPTEEDDS